MKLRLQPQRILWLERPLSLVALVVVGSIYVPVRALNRLAQRWRISCR